MPPFKNNHHCNPCKKTYSIRQGGYCDEHQTVCYGEGTAMTKDGVEKNITHGAWIHYKRESCERCGKMIGYIKKKNASEVPD